MLLLWRSVDGQLSQWLWSTPRCLSYSTRRDSLWLVQNRYTQAFSTPPPLNDLWLQSNLGRRQGLQNASGCIYPHVKGIIVYGWYWCQLIDANQALAWSSPHKWSHLSVWMQVPVQPDWLRTPETGRRPPLSSPPPATNDVLIRFCAVSGLPHQIVSAVLC